MPSTATTTASIFDEVTDQVRKWRWLPELRFVNHYHDEPGYIEALADSVRQWRAQHGGADKLLMSFHGIPQEYFEKGDPYFCECQKTGRLLAESLELDQHQWQLTFQSRLGPRQWLQPYTDKTLEQMGKQGTRSIQVLCPGFSADCLETLEEIAMENRDVFLEAGGQRYEYIPCLNATQAHIDMLTGLLERHLSGWPLDGGNFMAKFYELTVVSRSWAVARSTMSLKNPRGSCRSPHSWSPSVRCQVRCPIARRRADPDRSRPVRGRTSRR